MGNLREYSAALLQIWWALMSCAAFTILSVLSALKKQSNKFFVVGTALLAIMFFFVASYMAWMGQHRNLIALQERMKTPEFSGQLYSVLTGTAGRGNLPLIVVDGVLKNPIGPPSAVDNWRMGVEFPGSSIVWGEIPIMPIKDTYLRAPSGNAHIILSKEHWWPALCLQPIATGGATEGWFWSVFSNLDLTEAYTKHATVIVDFEDVLTGKRHRLGIGSSLPHEKTKSLEIYK